MESVGENTVYLSSNFSSLREINVDPASKYLTAYKNVLYNIGDDAPYFIPSAITRLELKPVKVIEKNFIYRLENVEEIVSRKGLRESRPMPWRSAGTSGRYMFRPA